MKFDTSGETLLIPQKGARRTSTAGDSRGLSPQIQKQSVPRLRVLALLYAFTFFMAAFVPNLVSEMDRAHLVADFAYFVPGVVAIIAALAIAAVTTSKRVPLALFSSIALGFLITSNYGIALAEYIDPSRLDNNGWIGLSWVAVWTPLFTVMVPMPQRRALIAILASVTSVPVVVGWMILSGRTIFSPSAAQFFFIVVFPYLLIAIMSYVGQAVVYSLGKEVTRAQELGSYRLVERLGQGGMGEVWRAKHRLLVRPAAIKLIRPSLMQGAGDSTVAGALRRFEREAQVTAQLRSPHTVELWDFGVSDDGGFYYVMELLDGLNLETLVKRHGPVPAERAIYLLRQVCRSLAEAEDNGLVHRDIKPANIFVGCYGGEGDFVTVLDFGIVKASHTAPLETAILATHENVVQGTPAFIAPEQALGRPDIDGRADIYATGCVAYWLLTGELVFNADTPMGVLLHHARTVPIPPSQRTELKIPPALDRLIMACLAKDPAARPQTARELSRRLGEIACPDAWNDERARQWWSQHEAGSLGSGLAIH